MSHDKTLFELVRHPLKSRLVQVLRTTDLAPRMRRVTFGGPELEGFTSLAPEDHVKIFFPRPGEPRPVMPTFGPLGVPLPKLGPKPEGRDYTPLRFDPDTRELDIDFFLHGKGIASVWASQAKPGDVVGIAGPRGSYVLKHEFDWQLFVGDETAWPEMVHRIAQLPAWTAALAVFVVDAVSDEVPMQGRPGTLVWWVHRRVGRSDVAQKLVDAVRAIQLPEGEGFAWIAGEATEVRAVCRHLLHDRGIDPSRLHSSGHWKRGTVAHDHHEPILVEGP